MPPGSSEQVAADSSATGTSAEGVEAAEEAESVEVSPPWPAEPVAETSQSWADLSEVQQAPAPSGIDSVVADSADSGGRYLSSIATIANSFHVRRFCQTSLQCLDII